MKTKSLPLYTKEIDEATRLVTGIFSVFGVLDHDDDIVHPGCFLNTFQAKAGQFLFLWQHDRGAPPTAIIQSLKEIPRNELPSDILAKYPGATGGAEVVRKYLNTPRANEVFEAIVAGSPLQMSYMYKALRYDYERLPDARYDWERIRHCREMELFEVSDVLWGSNPATRANKAKPNNRMERWLRATELEIQSLFI